MKYATAPGTRCRKAGISEHGNSEEHKQSVRLELLQRASWLQKEIEKKAEVADEVLVQAFAAFYFIAYRISYSVWVEGYAVLYPSI